MTVLRLPRSLDCARKLASLGMTFGSGGLGSLEMAGDSCGYAGWSEVLGVTAGDASLLR
jgi:hypothetical protein